MLSSASSSAFRASLRSATRSAAPRRLASTSTEKTAEAAQKKAQDFAQVALEYSQRAVELGKKALGPLGDRIANVFGAYRQPIAYNFAVARELAKQVYVTERLQPPTSLGTFLNAYSTIWQRASNPVWWREAARTGELAKVGVYAVEAYGIYKIGEIVGRRSLVGYKTN